MTIKELTEKLNLNIISGKNGLSQTLTGCYISDLLSDVVGHAQIGNIWITLHTHKNIVAVASLKKLSCILLVNNQTPSNDAIMQSDKEDIPILQTQLSTFEITGKIYNIINAQQ
jgi:serine kinase of HPr protein (carbohydrate metabolism regulator)